MRKRCNRKVVPALSGLDVVALRNRKPDADTTLKVKTRAHLALAELTAGALTRHGWDDIARCVNVSHLLACEKGIGAEYLADILSARSCLLEMGARSIKTGTSRMVARGPELTALNRLMEIHEAQLEVATAGDMSDVAHREHQLYVSGNRVTPRTHTPT
jgi:hypothetical protein